MGKVSRAKWEANIRKARQYVTNYGKVRFVIAQLALEVCDYSHGGRKGESVFSVIQFADEIEMDRKTLYDWIRVKRMVVDKLRKGDQKKIDKFLYQDLASVSNMVKEDASSAEVRRRLSEVLKEAPESRKFEKYLKSLNAIFYNVSRPMIMKDVAEKHITLMIEKTNVIHNLLKKELELRKKYSPEDRALRRVGLKGEIAKRVIQSGQ